MAKNTVPVNFKDDIINSSMGGKRRYKIINNSDGTISLEDATTYDQVGSNFGAAHINATNRAVNAAADASKVIDDIDAIRALTQEGYMAGAMALKQVDDSLVAEDNLKFQFATDGEGNYGYLGADDSFIPFKSGGIKEIAIAQRGGVTSGSFWYSIAVITPNERVGDTTQTTTSTYSGEYIKIEKNSSNATFTALKKGKYIHSNVKTFNIIECEENDVIYSGDFNSALVGTVVLAL